MTNAMTKFLGSLDAPDRRTLTKMSAEMDGDSLLSRMLRAVAVEVAVLQLDEAETLHQLEVDRVAELDEVDRRHPYPPASGPAVTFDPDAA